MTRWLLLPLALATACADVSGSTSRACAPITRSTATGVAAFAGTVFTIVLENHSRGDLLGSDDAPFFRQFAADNVLVAGYRDARVHPSEPNYFWMVAGENFGVLDDDDPDDHHLASRSHLADQLELAGLDWRAYMQSMGTPCKLANDDEYAVRHNPFVYFDDVNGWDGSAFHPQGRCAAHDVDYAQLDADLAAGAMPRYAFIVPDLNHDMHDGSVGEGDAWLAAEVPKIVASPAFQNGGVLFITADEGGGTPARDDPPMIVASPLAQHGFVSNVPYDTSAYLLTVQTLLGLEPLPCGATPSSITPMSDVFTTPLVGP